MSPSFSVGATRRQQLLFLLPVVLAVAAVLVVRGRLSYQFPVPWPDETGFISPAFRLAQSGGLFDPGMNPDRIVMWMPPGYMVLLAGAFRLFGYSFALVRWISAICMLGALMVMSRVAWNMTDGWRRGLAGWIVGGAFVSAYVLIDANIGRMEALFCLLMLVALAMGLAGRLYWMAALVGGAVVVHFNAVYFVLPVAVEGLRRLFAGRLAWPRRGDWLALGAAAACISAYAIHVALNWPGFRDDMRMQFAIKAFDSHNDPAHPAWMVWCAIGLLIGLVAWQRRIEAALLPALFGFGFVLMAHVGHEIWYDYGQPIGFALLALAWLAAPAPAGPWAARGVPFIATAAAVALTIGIGFRMTTAMAELRPHRAMLTRSFVPPAEIARVRRFIATLHPGDTVDFGWSGMENFFLADLARVGARWTMIRHSVTQNLPFRPSTWRVMCDSREVPMLVRQFDISFRRHGEDSGCAILPGLPSKPAREVHN